MTKKNVEEYQEGVTKQNSKNNVLREEQVPQK